MMCLTRRIESRSGTRRGSVFQYYLMYMILSSVLLTTSGLCLHSILTADRKDNQLSQHLKTLLRMDEALREDFLQPEFVSCDADVLVVNTVAGETPRWTIQRHHVRREVLADQDIVSSERFTFRKGTTLSFATDRDTQLIRLTLTEPSIVSSDASIDLGTTERKSVEILLHVAQTAAGTTVELDGPKINGDPTPATKAEKAGE